MVIIGWTEIVACPADQQLKSGMVGKVAIR
jgi:hypothetical protein